MWEFIARFVLKFRFFLLILLLAATVFMGYQASQVQMSYEFSRAIPTDNPKYIAYQAFRKKFGEDGNLLFIGIKTDSLVKKEFFNDYSKLNIQLRQINGVEQVLSVPAAVNLKKAQRVEKLEPVRIFNDNYSNQLKLDSDRRVFFSLPFYQTLLYNPETNAYLMAININKNILN